MRYEHTYQKIKVRSNLETNWLSAACISADRSFEGSARKTVEISARIRRADAGRLWLCGRERAISFGCELDERGGCEVSGVEFCEVTYLDDRLFGDQKQHEILRSRSPPLLRIGSRGRARLAFMMSLSSAPNGVSARAGLDAPERQEGAKKTLQNPRDRLCKFRDVNGEPSPNF